MRLVVGSIHDKRSDVGHKQILETTEGIRGHKVDVVYLCAMERQALIKNFRVGKSHFPMLILVTFLIRIFNLSDEGDQYDHVSDTCNYNRTGHCCHDCCS